MTTRGTVVASELGYEDKVILDAALRPEAGYEKFQELLRRYSRKDAIIVVGHNPSMTLFLNQLLSGGRPLNAIELKKGGVAKVEKDGRKPAVLKWCMPLNWCARFSRLRPAVRGQRPSRSSFFPACGRMS